MRVLLIILCAMQLIACGDSENDKAEQDSTRIEMHADSTRGFPNSNDTTPLSVDTMARRDTSLR